MLVHKTLLLAAAEAAERLVIPPLGALTALFQVLTALLAQAVAVVEPVEPEQVEIH
jgi:hypothetical protein